MRVRPLARMADPHSTGKADAQPFATGMAAAGAN